MVIITGRLARDAEANQIEDNKTVVHFTIVINDWYRPKDGEPKEHTEFIQCSYWVPEGITKILKKGAVVEAGGRIFPDAYMKDNEPQGQIKLAVQYVKVHAQGKNEGEDTPAEQQTQEPSGKKKVDRKKRVTKPGVEAAPVAAEDRPVDDLPF